MKEDNQKQFVCECGKSFDTQVKLSHHKTHCKVFQANKKQREIEEREARRLPNGLFKCDNPDCYNEHDGSYGSGRFCCDKCRNHYNSLQAYQTKKKNGTYISNFRFRKVHAHVPYGTWKCHQCEFIGKTRRELEKHKHELNHYDSCKGKPLSQQHRNKISKSLKIAVKEGRITGKAKTKEAELIRRKRMSEAALKRTNPSVSKRTEPYVQVDGTIVMLDSSYERKLAKLFDLYRIQWIRPQPLEWYSIDGKKHHYFPDFYLVDYDLYIDPKNDYCFKVQAEKIKYISEHYKNCIFLHSNELTIEKIFNLLECQSSPVTTPHC